MKFNNRVMHLQLTSLKKNEDLANQEEEKCATLKEVELSFQVENPVY